MFFGLRFFLTHSKRKATAAICLYLGICAKGKSIALRSGVSNSGLKPTVPRKSTYSNLVLNFAPYLSEVDMEKILTSRTVAVSEFKRAPNEIVAEANGEPIAVLTNNKPSFYVISPSAYEELLEKLWEIEITPSLVKRLDDLRTGKTKSIEVTLKDLVK
ncbi:MAG: hypothetical protein FGM63_04755 [Candidatus Nanopelagicaceae bacterium]|nr:hypothetical protein [Candidatus Nanopelagicaceae bacterium]